MEGKLFDAERKFMELIWAAEPVNSTQLCRMAREALGWKKSTTYSMLKRLAQRGAVKNERAVVTALISRDEVRLRESRELLEHSFGGSVPAFFAAFLRDARLTEAEAGELLRMIEEARQ